MPARPLTAQSATMLRLPSVLSLLLMPALAFAEDAHNGVVVPRTGPEPADIATFLAIAVGLWLGRRAMRARKLRSGPPARD